MDSHGIFLVEKFSVMIYIDKTTIPHCYIEEKKFEWGETYTCTTPIFNVSINPELPNIEFTIELLGKNNFKDTLLKLYNILLNLEEKERLDDLSDAITNRESLLKKINDYLAKNTNNRAPWKDNYEVIDETYYLEMIEHDLQRKLCYETKNY